MEIKLAKHAGFCFGVKRATQIAFNAAEDRSGSTYTLGPIIHSPQVVGRLADLGVKLLDSLDGIDSGTVIIRSHGVTAGEMSQAVGKRLEILDATCPFVKKAQAYVKTLADEGYSVIVVGEADHPEVMGIVSYSSATVHVVADDKAALLLPRMKKVGIVAQTTQSFETLKHVVDTLLPLCAEMRVYNTICDATSVRQREAVEMARECDLMLIIGGYNSANTRRLAEVCSEIQPQTHHIESADQVDGSWFDGVASVGVTAGASTPKWLIDEVLERINALVADKKD
jgi:4-hydroxy-3-methylbut-2-enyl diphosphate reductase